MEKKVRTRKKPIPQGETPDKNFTPKLTKKDLISQIIKKKTKEKFLSESQKIYELYSKLPIIILDKIDDLKNFDLINEKYDSIKKTQSNLNMIDMNYWINKIKNEINQ
jgi:hypothetical protein